MVLDFTGKRAVVTGGANGIGNAMARVLAAAGARVVIFDIASERPAEAAAAFGGEGRVLDVTGRAALGRAFAEIVPDVVMANAGISGWEDLQDTTPESWNRIIGVNLTGAFYTVHAAAESMMPRRTGAIVITASTNSYEGEAGLVAYNSAKAGLLGVLHTTANELGPYGIRVNAVCPGLIRTRLTEPFFFGTERGKEYFRNIPLGRGGSTEEVANAAVILASDLASFVTGAALFVDGGQMAARAGTWDEERAEFIGDHWRLRG